MSWSSQRFHWRRARLRPTNRARARTKRRRRNTKSPEYGFPCPMAWSSRPISTGRPGPTGREIPRPARVPALPQGRVARSQLFPVFLLPDHGYVVARVDIRGTGNSEGVTIPYEYSDIELDDGEDVIAWLAESAVVHGQGRHVRHLLGRLQFHSDGAAQPARAESLRRGHGHRLLVRGGRALHRRHHAHRLVDDEQRLVQRVAGRTGLRHGRGLGEDPLRREAQRLRLYARTTRRRLLGPRSARGQYEKLPRARLSHRRLVRRLSQQPAAHARARRCAGESDDRSLGPLLPARCLA